MALAHMTDDFDSDGSERGTAARFFGVIADPRAYGALLYMVLAFATGIFYFTWVVTGLSLSLGLMILIIGIPLALLFLGSVRVLSILEGYLARGLLGAVRPPAMEPPAPSSSLAPICLRPSRTRNPSLARSEWDSPRAPHGELFLKNCAALCR